VLKWKEKKRPLENRATCIFNCNSRNIGIAKRGGGWNRCLQSRSTRAGEKKGASTLNSAISWKENMIAGEHIGKKKVKKQERYKKGKKNWFRKGGTSTPGDSRPGGLSEKMKLLSPGGGSFLPGVGKRRAKGVSQVRARKTGRETS